MSDGPNRPDAGQYAATSRVHSIKSIEHVGEFTVPRPMEICGEVGDAGERFRDLADDVELMERAHRSEDNDL